MVIDNTQINLGNWVEKAILGTSIPVKVDIELLRISETGFDWNSSGYNTPVLLFPIMLTRTILINAGFKKNSGSNVFILDDWITLTLEDDNWEEPSFDVYVKGTYITCVESVHELQNFYKGITMNELDMDFLKDHVI